MSDLIDRQKAIDAMCSVCGNDCDKSDFVYDAPQDEQVILCPEHYALTSLPSAQPERCEDCENFGKTRLLIPQPEKRTEERTETHACDLISRTAAIDAADRADYTGLAVEDVKKVTDEVVKELKQLPSAQPEPVTNCHDLTAAIEAIERIFDRCEEIEAHLPEGDPDRVGYKMYPDWLTVWKYLHQVPSAQPDLQSTCNQLATDTISRQAALDCVTYDVEYTTECIKALPPAQPEQRWIPCSERLPEDVEIGEEYPTVIFCTKDIVYVGFYEYYKGGKWWTAEDYTVDNVIAWMPLPEPYREEK